MIIATLYELIASRFWLPDVDKPCTQLRSRALALDTYLETIF